MTWSDSYKERLLKGKFPTPPFRALKAPRDPTTYLYRCFGPAGDERMYIGIAANVEKRMAQHRRLDFEWWHEVDESRTMVEAYPTLSAARAAETIAIHSENPRHNLAQVKGKVKRRPPWPSWE